MRNDSENVMMAGLDQLDSVGLKRIIGHKGNMLLNGAIYEDGTG
jgi:hypothetical protein